MHTNTIIAFALLGMCGLLEGCTSSKHSTQQGPYYPDSAEEMAARRDFVEGLAARRDIEGLTKQMQSVELIDRIRAVWFLGKFGADAKNAVSGLVQLLKYDTNTVVRAGAALALGKIGVYTTEVLLALGEGLWDNDHGVRESAYKALQMFRPGTVEHISELTDIFHHSGNLGVRYAALTILTYPGSPGISVVKDALRDSDKNIKIWAAILLRGAVAKEAIPELIQSLSDPDLRWSTGTDFSAFSALVKYHRAVESLQSIGPEIIPQLIQLLQDPREQVREYILSSLGRFGPKARAAVPAILNVLKNGTYHDRRYASSALCSMGYASIPYLLLALQSKDEIRDGWSFHDDVIRILTGMGWRAEVLLPRLQKLMYPAVGWGTKADIECAEPALREALSHNQPAVREAAKNLLTLASVVGDEE